MNTHLNGMSRLNLLKRREFVRAAGLALAGAAFAPGAAPAQEGAGALRSERQVQGLPKELIYPDESTLAPPPKNFSSNHNYYIYGGGKPILDLVVTIDIHEDLVAPDAMSMQLNCTSPEGANCVYQQFVTGMSSLEKSPTLLMGSSIENFPSEAYREQLHASIGFHLKGDLFNEHFHFGNFPAHRSGMIPAGWKVKWEVFTKDDGDGRVLGAQYTVSHDHGQFQTSGPQMIKNFKISGTKVPVGPETLAPIFALQMNMVGTNGGQFKHVKSGAGTITYESSTKLVAMGGKPPALATYPYTTETSNIVYAELSSTPANKIVQKFRAKPGENGPAA